MVTKVADVRELVKNGIANTPAAMPSIKALARSPDWAEREVSATALVEISKKKPEKVITEMLAWSKDRDPNVRRTASEALRHIARKDPPSVLPVLENLRADSNLYVKKSVANVLRNAGNYHPDFVLEVCAEWATLRDANTNWIIKDGLRKLRTKHSAEAELILDSLSSTRT